jgi:hypothetical protein
VISRRSSKAFARLGLALGCALTLMAGTAEAVGPAGGGDALRALVGTYQNQAPDGGREAIEAATDAALDDAGPVVRLLAKPRIVDNNPPFDGLSIARRGPNVEVSYGEGVRTYRAPIGGPPVEQRSPDGTEVEVRYELRGGVLVEHADARQGGAVTTYRPTDEGLILETTITASRLPTPVHFVMHFRRR